MFVLSGGGKVQTNKWGTGTVHWYTVRTQMGTDMVQTGHTVVYTGTVRVHIVYR